MITSETVPTIATGKLGTRFFYLSVHTCFTSSYEEEYHEHEVYIVPLNVHIVFCSVSIKIEV